MHLMSQMSHTSLVLILVPGRYAGPFVPFGLRLLVGPPANYSDKQGPGGCKTTADWEDDFRKIKSWSTNEWDKFDTVKIFETAACDTLANAVPAAIKTNMMIWAGMWPSDIDKWVLHCE